MILCEKMNTSKIWVFCCMKVDQEDVLDCYDQVRRMPSSTLFVQSRVQLQRIFGFSIHNVCRGWIGSSFLMYHIFPFNIVH